MKLEFTNLGGLQSPYDYRMVPAGLIATGIPLPASFKNDISPFPIWNQKKIGSCVGHALAKHMQIYWYRKTGQLVDFSPRWLYAMAKCVDEWEGEGTYPATMAKIMKDYGCATEATVPNNSDLTHENYVYQRKMENIPKAAFKEAEKYKIPGYAFVDMKNTEEVKRVLYENGPFAGLLRLGKEWWTDENGISTWDKNKINPLRPPKVIVSGHEIVLYGYDETSFYDLSNSWSSLWNDSGNGTISISKYAPFLIEGLIIKELPPPIVDEVKRLPKKPKHKFLIDLAYGTMKNPEVVALQDCLKYEGLMPAVIPSTGNYLEETRKAVLAFQKKYKLINLFQEITYQGRFCYLLTRTKLNELYN